MDFGLHTPRSSSFHRWWPLGLLVLGLAGCHRQGVTVYQIPKERPETAAAHPDMGAAHPDIGPGHPDVQSAPAPQIHYQVPAGWTEGAAGGMRVARFAAPGKTGQPIDVSIIPLAGMTATKLAVVNLWRDQIKLKAVPEDELAKISEKVPVGKDQGDLFDMVSTEPLVNNQLKARILVAMLKQGDTAWFFKMTGDDESVRAQKPAFLALLKSVTFEAAAPATPEAGRMASTQETPAKGIEDTGGAPAKPQWSVPPGWQEVPPTQMLVAKFLLTGKTGGKGEVTVSVFPGTVGGTLANVNRWRGQIGLPPVPESELPKLTQSLDVAGGKATVVDMGGQDPRNGQKTRLIGVIFPQEGRTWFYKLTGDDSVAEQEKPVFLRFVQTAKHPNA